MGDYRSVWELVHREKLRKEMTEIAPNRAVPTSFGVVRDGHGSRSICRMGHRETLMFWLHCATTASQPLGSSIGRSMGRFHTYVVRVCVQP